MGEYYLWKFRPTYQTEHFGFGFKTQNLKDILGFQFTLLDFNTNKIEFVDGKKKKSILIVYNKYYQHFPEFFPSLKLFLLV